mmetsp:Transcript_12115/g.34678  ORF Transcript_12115/g.34678 Transcript_12115/m.34678 type:complete len:218 (-) Transcript_12115:1261-1914(-)
MPPTQPISRSSTAVPVGPARRGRTCGSNGPPETILPPSRPDARRSPSTEERGLSPRASSNPRLRFRESARGAGRAPSTVPRGTVPSYSCNRNCWIPPETTMWQRGASPRPSAKKLTANWKMGRDLGEWDLPNAVAQLDGEWTLSARSSGPSGSNAPLWTSTMPSYLANVVIVQETSMTWSHSGKCLTTWALSGEICHPIPILLTILLIYRKLATSTI